MKTVSAMRTLLIIVVLVVFGIVFTSRAQAAVLVCDPNPEVTTYKITIGENAIVFDAQSDGSMQYDISAWSGVTGGTVCCGREWVLNNVPQGVTEWSSTVPFSISGGAVSDGLSNMRVEE